MLTKVVGLLVFLVGAFLFLWGPEEPRIQPAAFGNTMRLLGLIMIIVGIILFKF